MKEEGPELVLLMARQRATPPEYLLKARVEVDTAALYCDLIEEAGGAAEPQSVRDDLLVATTANPNLGQLVQLAAWLLRDAWFRGEGKRLAEAPCKLCTRLVRFARLVRCADVMSDEERREEFVRLVLDALQLRPQGETDVKAHDRLDALDSVARATIAEDSKKAYERAKAVARQVADAAAEAAAAKTSRE